MAQVTAPSSTTKKQNIKLVQDLETNIKYYQNSRSTAHKMTMGLMNSALSRHGIELVIQEPNTKVSEKVSKLSMYLFATGEIFAKSYMARIVDKDQYVSDSVKKTFTGNKKWEKEDCLVATLA